MRNIPAIRAAPQGAPLRARCVPSCRTARRPMRAEDRSMRSFAAAGIALFVSCAAPSARAEIAAPVLEWQRCASSYCDRAWYASPALVETDGAPLVLGGGARLLAVRGDTGALAWTYPPAGSAGRIWPAVAVADVDGDGAREIAVVQYDALSVLDASGALRPGWPVSPFATGEMRTLAVADLDGDGAHELLTAATSGSSSGARPTWTVLDGSGAVRAGWPRLASGDAGWAAGAYNQNLAAGDLDGDGELEIAASSDVHYLAAFGDDGAPLAASAIYGAGKTWAQVGVHWDPAVDLRGWANCAAGPPLEPRPNFADAAPAIGDLDGDGANEIVIVGGFYDCRADGYPQLFQVPMVFAADRTRWRAGPHDWTTPPAPDAFAAPLSLDYEEIESAEANPVLADLDGDGAKEILYASYDGRVHAFWLDGAEHGAWPFDVSNDADPDRKRFASEPVVADLDGDGAAEVLFATWTDKASGASGDLVIAGALGQERARTALPRSTASWDGALAAPTLAQLDADANLEVIVNTAHTGLVAYEIPGSSQARVVWPTGRGGFARAAPEPSGALAAACALGALAATARLRRAAAVAP
ncbi:MAG: hypothetical protein DCC71_00255 [Proteobacteria bacterium]|nr:MAG: hypothetical protein DCC71_00255 [Pseudomonadota bacterium]